MPKSVIITVILSQKQKKGDLIYGSHRKNACASRCEKKKGHRAFDIAPVSLLFLSVQPEISLFSFKTVMVAVPSLLVTSLLKVRENRVCCVTSIMMELEPYALTPSDPVLK